MLCDTNCVVSGLELDTNITEKPRSEDPNLIIRVTTFELVQPICPPRCLNVTGGQTDVRLTKLR